MIPTLCGCSQYPWASPEWKRPRASVVTQEEEVRGRTSRVDVDYDLRGLTYLLLPTIWSSTHSLFVTHPALHSLAEIRQDTSMQWTHDQVHTWENGPPSGICRYWVLCELRECWQCAPTTLREMSCSDLLHFPGTVGTYRCGEKKVRKGCLENAKYFRNMCLSGHLLCLGSSSCCLVGSSKFTSTWPLTCPSSLSTNHNSNENYPSALHQPYNVHKAIPCSQDPHHNPIKKAMQVGDTDVGKHKGLGFVKASDASKAPQVILVCSQYWELLF